ncbi:hypothetical protein [Prevotella nigrescens]
MQNYLSPHAINIISILAVAPEKYRMWRPLSLSFRELKSSGQIRIV